MANPTCFLSYFPENNNLWITLSNLNSYIKWQQWRSISASKWSSGTQWPFGAGTWPWRTVPSARTASTRPALSVRPIRFPIVRPAWSAGAPATTPTTRTASVGGPPRRRIRVLSARRPGIQSKLLNSDIKRYSSIHHTSYSFFTSGSLKGPFYLDCHQFMLCRILSLTPLAMPLFSKVSVRVCSISSSTKGWYSGRE